MIIPLVREASIVDVPAIAAVGRRSFVAAYADSTGPQDLRAHVENHFSVAAIRAAMTAESGAYLLAEIRTDPAGFAKVCRASPPPHTQLTGVACKIDQLYVDPSFQRRGVGDALLTAASERARGAGVSGLWLSVWENARWAIAFYESRGFRPVGTTEFHVGSTPYDDLLMWLPLSAEPE